MDAARRNTSTRELRMLPAFSSVSRILVGGLATTHKLNSARHGGLDIRVDLQKLTQAGRLTGK